MFMTNVRKCLKIFNKVYVSSDSREMLALASKAGAKPILRYENLCGDVPNIPVYQHALEYMGKVKWLVAVQANSPNVDPNLIVLTKKLLFFGAEEVMTCHPDRSLYGSIWAMTTDRLRSYGDPYGPQPDVLLVENSIDIHSHEDYIKSIKLSLK
jgi:hypothetical protein